MCDYAATKDLIDIFCSEILTFEGIHEKSPHFHQLAPLSK